MLLLYSVVVCSVANKPVPAPSRQVRGNSKDRKARRAWLAGVYGILGKNGKPRWVVCHLCSKPCLVKSLSGEVDRFPVCGHDGGRYNQGNILPACLVCNRGRCASCPSRVKPGQVLTSKAKESKRG